MAATVLETNEVEDGLSPSYRQACRLAVESNLDAARRLYGELQTAAIEPQPRALIGNDLAALDAMAGDLDAARAGLEAALAIDETCQPARLNLELLRAWESRGSDAGLSSSTADKTTGQSPSPRPSPRGGGGDGERHGPEAARVAIVSFLFNWPSTGGGNIHTVELATFLGRAGYEVRHFYPQFADWGIGGVQDELPIASEALEFDVASWNLPAIAARFRSAVDRFGPDSVIITDAWNMKPRLGEAMRGYAYFLRFQALECLCPLNNLRLLARGPEQFEQCPRNQLATPSVCRRCLAELGEHSGPLHQCERALAGVGTIEYDRVLRRSLQEAEAVLALNPLIAALLEPHARRVCVVPWGMDAARFPLQKDEGGRMKDEFEPGRDSFILHPSSFILFLAAVAGETIKGFHVAHEACRLLRQTRSDFELVVTFDPPGPIDEFTRSVGWCSQAELPRHYRAADICLVPTIAQEGLSRTSVEAMASGIPVVASRIGGLPFTVNEGVTGLLCEPGDPADLAREIARLLDDPDLRRTMGLAGRRRFEQEFTWESVIDRYYRPLLARREVASRML